MFGEHRVGGGELKYTFFVLWLGGGGGGGGGGIEIYMSTIWFIDIILQRKRVGLDNF